MNSIDFLPNKFSDNEYWQIITTLIDYVITEYCDTDYEHIKYKYDQLDHYDSEFLTYIVQEFGYDYILPILNLTEEEQSVIFNYLTPIHQLKGTKQGLELVLRLLGITYTITEWWEDTTPPDTYIPYPYTFRLDFYMDDGKLKYNSIKLLKSFIRQYVYPIWNFILIYLTEGTVNTLGAGNRDRTYEIGSSSPLLFPMTGSVDVSTWGSIYIEAHLTNIEAIIYTLGAGNRDRLYRANVIL